MVRRARVFHALPTMRALLENLPLPASLRPWFRHAVMRIISLILGLCAALAASSPAHAQEAPVLEVGQVWSVKDMAPDVRFTIMRIEPWSSGRVVHGSISGFGRVEVRGQSITPDAGHIPFEEDAVRRSVLELKGAGAKPTATFEQGYAQWRAANGGAFTLTISEAIKSLLGTVATGRVTRE